MVVVIGGELYWGGVESRAQRMTIAIAIRIEVGRQTTYDHGCSYVRTLRY